MGQRLLHRLLIVVEYLAFHRLIVGSKADDLELALGRETLDEKFHGVLGDLHSSSTHGPAAVNKEHVEEIFPVGQLSGLRLFVFSNLGILRLWGLHRRDERSHHCDLIRVLGTFLEEQLRVHHLGGAVEKPKTSGGLVAFDLRFGSILVKRGCRLGWRTDVSDLLARLDIELIVD